MPRIVFDIETDGFLEELTEVYCLGYQILGAEEQPQVVTGDPVASHLELVMDADEIIGHNIIAFDIPAIQKVYPWFKPRGKITDTLVDARLLWTDVKDRDFRSKRDIPPGLVGKHSLEAWGHRLGAMKGDFKPEDHGVTWNTVRTNPTAFEAMLEYCEQDVRVTVALHELIERKLNEHDWTEARELEHAVQHIIARQQRHGWVFDVDKAEALVARLQIRKVELEDELRRTFPPFYVRDGKEQTPKRDNKRYGYAEGAPLQKVKRVEFNPGSRDHIANRLTFLYDWTPVEFTDKGRPKVDETTLEQLAHIPEAALLVDYLTVDKRLGQIAEGKQAWLKQVRPTGRIHGSVNSNGAVTGRMTHFNPNVAQVPRNSSPYGEECRSLFIVPPGKKLVGCDAEGLELRNLGHYQAPFDGGVFGRAVVEGDKKAGTDAHSLTRDAIEFNDRDNAKTFRYALMYGAGDYKLGLTTVEDFTEEKKARFYKRYPAGKKRSQALVRLGRKRRQLLMEGITGFGELVERIKKRAKQRGWLRGLDGRRVYCRAQHAALNTLLQSAGAIVMKKALVLMDEDFQARGWVPGEHYEFVGNIHDEVQIESDEELADEVGRIAARAIERAGECYRFRVPLAGDYAVGDSWAETH